LTIADDSIVVGVDTGGTFTDLVAIARGKAIVHKVLSTPHDPAVAVIAGLRAMLAGRGASMMTYSSTVATNALLERKGARVAIVTNSGFEDVIEIARQNRIDLYDLAPRRPVPLVDASMRIGARERTYFDGTIALRLTDAELRRVADAVRTSRAQSIAVCLLNSYANDIGENRIARALKRLGLPISISSGLSAEYREYERFSTAVVNAYVAPLMGEHLRSLCSRLGRTRMRVMQSDASAIGERLARREPVRTILSGPAAGVAGAEAIAREAGINRFISFDMGGTSTDVSLYDRRVRIRTLSHPDGHAIRTPVIDIHTVGAGGGSIARVDSGGALHVGPESAGASPGPACYGRGAVPTVSDANLIAGRLSAQNFLGGAMRLDIGRAERALRPIARAMKCTVAAAARGIIRVVNANMERSIRVISVERGFDPREFALLAFGGAGPMHACELALDLGIRHIVMPANPGLLCAWGAARAPLGREHSLALRAVNPKYTDLARRAKTLERRATSELKSDGARPADIRVEARLAMRYRGQSYELDIDLSPNFARDFHSEHQKRFGHSAPDADIEIVNVRVRAHAGAAVAYRATMPRGSATPAALAHSRTIVGDRGARVPIYARETLGTRARLRGPALIVELSATTYVAPEFSARVDRHGNIHLVRSQ
jgi:N-methylhydantoinase A/oxoprolinase/acetone carboxylase beta subunit